MSSYPVLTAHLPSSVGGTSEITGGTMPLNSLRLFQVLFPLEIHWDCPCLMQVPSL